MLVVINCADEGTPPDVAYPHRRSAVVVLRGSGGNDWPRRFVAFVREIQRVYARLARLPQVTVAEIGGAATFLEYAANAEVQLFI